VVLAGQAAEPPGGRGTLGRARVRGDPWRGPRGALRPDPQADVAGTIDEHGTEAAERLSAAPGSRDRRRRHQRRDRADRRTRSSSGRWPGCCHQLSTSADPLTAYAARRHHRIAGDDAVRRSRLGPRHRRRAHPRGVPCPRRGARVDRRRVVDESVRGRPAIGSALVELRSPRARRAEARTVDSRPRPDRDGRQPPVPGGRVRAPARDPNGLRLSLGAHVRSPIGVQRRHPGAAADRPHLPLGLAAGANRPPRGLRTARSAAARTVEARLLRRGCARGNRSPVAVLEATGPGALTLGALPATTSVPSRREGSQLGLRQSPQRDKGESRARFIRVVGGSHGRCPREVLVAGPGCGPAACCRHRGSAPRTRDPRARARASPSGRHRPPRAPTTRPCAACHAPGPTPRCHRNTKTNERPPGLVAFGGDSMSSRPAWERWMRIDGHPRTGPPGTSRADRPSRPGRRSAPRALARKVFRLENPKRSVRDSARSDRAASRRSESARISGSSGMVGGRSGPVYGLGFVHTARLHPRYGGRFEGCRWRGRDAMTGHSG